MKKRFYSHIVQSSTFFIELDNLHLSDREKAHLLEIIDDSMYHTVLDAILSELSPHDKKVFLEHVAKEDDDKIWEFLHTKVENIETKIKLAADQLTKELHKDIKEVK